jgi:hypothetical protein
MKKLMITTAFAAFLVGGGAAVATAQPGGGPDGPFRTLMADGKLTKAELTASLDKKFSEMDLNHDGKITPEERQALRDKRMDERFAKIDTDGNGQISKAEFKAAHDWRGKGAEAGKGEPGKDGPRMGMRRHGGMGGGFGMGRGMDGNRDGTLTRDEFMARPLAWFDKADANKDGVVTADEAKAARPARGEGPRGHWGKRGGQDGGDMPPPPPAQGD